MFDRFTDRARNVMALAGQEAKRFNHESIGTEHILLGILKEGRGVGAQALKNFGVDLAWIRPEIELLIKPGAAGIAGIGDPPMTPRAQKAVEYAREESRVLNHNYVGSEHLLLGLLRENEGIAAQTLRKFGLTAEKARQQVIDIVGLGTEGAPQITEPHTISQATATPAPIAYPVLPGRFAEAWVSLIIGAILLYLVPNTPRYLMSIAHWSQPPLPMWDGTAYARSSLVLPDASVAAFAAVLILGGVIFLLMPRRNFLILLLFLTGSAVALNLVAIIIEWNKVSPLFPGLAVAYGGYQCFYLASTLGLRRRPSVV